MKIRVLQSSFVAGELSPDMFGREDFPPYSKGLGKGRNVYVLPQGGAKVREGLALVDRVTNDAPARLVSFEFNTEQVYLLCFTPGEMKVYKDDVGVATVTTAPISALTAPILDQLNWTQSADTLLLFHGDLQTAKVTRTSHTAWTTSSVTFANIPTYNFGSGAEAVISVTRGWPVSGAFFGSRLWLGGVKSRPQTLLGSNVGDYFNLNKGTLQDDEGIDVTIDDDRVNAIRNLFPGRTLQIFTSGGEFFIQAAAGDPVTPTKIADQLKKASLHGCTRTRPISIDGATLFVEDGGSVVRSFLYSDLEQSYNAPNISRFSPHLIVNPARSDVRAGTESFPVDVVYFVNEDGTMAVLSVSRDEEFLAWTLFETDGAFEDVAVVGNTVYVLVRRVIQGNVCRFIERLDADFKTDCAVRLNAGVYSMGPWLWFNQGLRSTTWSGLNHLEGKTVKLLGDDFVLLDTTVSGGAVTSSEAVTSLEVGLNFAPLLRLLPVPLALGGQSYASEYKRLVSLDMRLLNSRGVVVRQTDGRRYKPLWHQFGAAVLDLPVKLFTGWKRVYLGGYNRDAEVEITREDPLEFHVLSAKLSIGV